MALEIFVEVVEARRRLSHGLRLVTDEPNSVAAVRAELIQIMASALALIEKLDAEGVR